MQPVVVRQKAGRYELIDGQQRLTTLYLIYRYLFSINAFFSEPAFSLVYETRSKSAEFLRNLDANRKNENIDFWFIANAYEAIKEWFTSDLKLKTMNVYRYFEEFVQVIWYQIGKAEDAISLFTRLNIGKIPLTSAELVKAMFLSKDADSTISRKSRRKLRSSATTSRKRCTMMPCGISSLTKTAGFTKQGLTLSLI